MKERDIKPHEAQRIPQTWNPKRPTSRYVMIKTPRVKYKERILKAAREKQSVNDKGAPIRLVGDFSKETVQD